MVILQTHFQIRLKKKKMLTAIWQQAKHRALDTGQFRFWSKFKVLSCVQKWPS